MIELVKKDSYIALGKDNLSGDSEAIYNRGYDKGYKEGLETGAADEYNSFWDNFQQNGKRTNYSKSFAVSWTKDIFKPKYDIQPTDATEMFRNSEMQIDLVEHLNNLGITLDFSKATVVTGLFQSSLFTHVGEISCVSATGILYYTFLCGTLVTIDKWILKDDGSQGFYNTFNLASSLENITVEGVIGQNGLNLQWSTKLSKASITSIINALSTTTSGLTITLSKTAVNNAFGGINTTEWKTLIATKSNWTISLV